MIFVSNPKCLCIISKNVRINTKEFDELFFLIQNQTLVSAHPPILVKDYFKNSQGKISLEKIILREILCFATSNWERRQRGQRSRHKYWPGGQENQCGSGLACLPARQEQGKTISRIILVFTLYINSGYRLTLETLLVSHI